MTRGMKSSEFYVTIFCVCVSSFGAMFFNLDGGQIGAINACGLAYIGGRSYIKKGDKDE